MNIDHFEDIKAWQLARRLTSRVYSLATGNSFAKDFALRDQITRAAGSAMHNTAEGFDADSDAEFIRFLNYARRSCTEVQSQLYIALDQAYIDEAQFAETYEIAAHTHAKLGAFIKYLKSSSVSPDRKRSA